MFVEGNVEFEKNSTYQTKVPLSYCMNRSPRVKGRHRVTMRHRWIVLYNRLTTRARSDINITDAPCNMDIEILVFFFPVSTFKTIDTYVLLRILETHLIHCL